MLEEIVYLQYFPEGSLGKGQNTQVVRSAIRSLDFSFVFNLETERRAVWFGSEFQSRGSELLVGRGVELANTLTNGNSLA